MSSRIEERATQPTRRRREEPPFSEELHLMMPTPRPHPYRQVHVLEGGLQHTIGGLTRRLHLTADGLVTGRERPLDASRLLARADEFARGLDDPSPTLDHARDRLRDALRRVLREL